MLQQGTLISNRGLPPTDESWSWWSLPTLQIDTRNEAVKGSVREINIQNYVAKHLKGKDDRTDSRFYAYHAGTDFTCLQEVRMSQYDSFYCP